VLSLYLLPVFINILLGTIVIISGKQLVWTLTKGAFVVIGAGVSYFAIPYWQARTGNGGLAAAGVTVGAEMGMLLVALMLVPRGLFEAASLIDLEGNYNGTPVGPVLPVDGLVAAFGAERVGAAREPLLLEPAEAPVGLVAEPHAVVRTSPLARTTPSSQRASTRPPWNCCAYSCA